ncbi:leucine-rich repeat-containing protein 71 [Scophthalmus maximus]|uniref:leucine-rich repeat-containing protein 71 n=1 Tax=Scophthalmus maximus TaxID=52904 RepID=UPI001FA8A642|nr:leucine-rich repeat-containing protein 71 [Scophthalmus maximus]
MSRKKHAKDKTEKSNAEDEKHTGHTPCEALPAQTFDEYQCSGDVEIDFPGLCALLDIKDVPAVSVEQPAPSSSSSSSSPSSSSAVTERRDAADCRAQVPAASTWTKRCLRVELEDEDPLGAKSVTVSGWRVDEQIVRVLQKMLSSLSQLQSLQFWQAGLTGRMVVSLMDTVSLCSNLRVVTLDGNPDLPDQSYHCLLSEDSNLTHLSLRNNRIGDDIARLIGSSLSTTRSSNKNLLSLNLAFNSIGDAGAAHIAQGLRLNRALLFLSLANNQIGDSGAAHLAAILGDFALTHDEVVERRRLLLERTHCSPRTVDLDQAPAAEPLPSVPSSTSLIVRKGSSKRKEAPKRAEKHAANKESLKSNKKSSDVKTPQSKVGKPADKEKQITALTVQSNTSLNELQVESVGTGRPLLDQSLQYRDGRLFLPGNSTLASLNLTGNRITEKSLPLFLSSLEMQGDGGGLLRLRLQRNHFPPECESHVTIKELMALRHKPGCEETEEEGQGEKS